MTVIAWDGKVLASDSCLSDEFAFYHGNFKKLYRLKTGGMVGISGDADSRAVIHLLDNVKDEADLPTKAELEATRCDGDYILVLPDKTVWLISINYNDDSKSFFGEVVKAGLKQVAIGHGGDMARAAMALGKTSSEAVRQACKFSLACRPPVQTMKLEDKPKEKIKRARKPAQPAPEE